MQVTSIFCTYEDDVQQYYVVLGCACIYPITEDLLHVEDLPCPLHEEHRYFWVQPTPHFPDEDDAWEGSD